MKCFRGSLCVIFLFFSMTFCSILSAAVLSELSSGDRFAEEFISDHTKCVQIVSKGQANTFTYGNLAEFIDQHPEITIFRTNFFDHSLEIYTPHAHLLSEQYGLTHGTDFSAEQLISGNHIVLISDNVILFTQDRNGTLVYSHRNHEYTVSGMITNSEFDCIVPLYTALRDEYEQPVSDMVYINAGDDTQEVIHELEILILSADKHAEINIDSVNADRRSSVIEEAGTIVLILAALVAVIFLCMSSVTEYWVGTRRRELFVRLLSGADDITAIKRLITDFLIISFSSVLIGTVCAAIFISLGLFGLNSPGFTALYMISTAIVVLSVGIGTIEVYLRIRKMSNEPICQLRR